jgi:hypothetical protein
MTEPDPNTFRAANCDKGASVPGSYKFPQKSEFVNNNLRRDNLLTERHRASNLSSKCVVHVPRMVRQGPEYGWDDERVRAKRLNFEHLVGLLHHLVQPDCLLELVLPLRACLCGPGVDCIETREPANVQDCARIYDA